MQPNQINQLPLARTAALLAHPALLRGPAPALFALTSCRATTNCPRPGNLASPAAAYPSAFLQKRLIASANPEVSSIKATRAPPLSEAVRQVPTIFPRTQPEIRNTAQSAMPHPPPLPSYASQAGMPLANGVSVIKSHHVNRGSAFKPNERDALRLSGLLPPAVESLDLQKARVLEQLRLKTSDIEKYVFLSTLKNSNTTLFYKTMIEHLDEFAPIIYTPTVGEACIKWSHIYNPSNAEGLYLSIANKGNIRKILDNWPYPDPDITVITDGSRILGLGDLGLNGMGIPVGKLSLYIGAAGFNPARTLPITLDMGTNTEPILNDPLYLGTRRKRPSDPEFFEFVDEVMAALKDKWPAMLVQFEDFSSEHAFGTLERYRNKYMCFNDDIQGTGAVILSGFINAVKQSGIPVSQHKLLFYGAGSAGVGVALQIRDFFVKEGGLSEAEANARFFLMDTKGLVTLDRGDKLAQHKIVLARRDNGGKQFRTIEEVIDAFRPTALIGLCTMGGVFTPSTIRKMADVNDRPIIMPLSNPLKNAECTFEQAMVNTDGRVLFASGTGFPLFKNPETGKVTKPGQGNNMYIFPGLGLGAVLSRAKHVNDNMVYTSAAALANSLNDAERAEGLIYPALPRIRDICAEIAVAVAKEAVKDGLAMEEEVIRMANANKDDELLAWVKERMYNPNDLQ
ncbi:malic enzyme protein 2 [Gonapodya prolifera JEL478]|uniref:Malic enzyme n=1 Tax=Gonapodya prolifera (strain JEL478) TaxID=1344416 RepID=A0A139AZC6_GONPJ|nr:malic enzyme protein 2 [Gonapodya prolifera JEL478]|eukprot:KXS22086.1 malic enzyme protein 2 [Gonapodya prolifera JEL478]